MTEGQIELGENDRGGRHVCLDIRQRQHDYVPDVLRATGVGRPINGSSRHIPSLVSAEIPGGTSLSPSLTGRSMPGRQSVANQCGIGGRVGGHGCRSRPALCVCVGRWCSSPSPSLPYSRNLLVVRVTNGQVKFCTELVNPNFFSTVGARAQLS